MAALADMVAPYDGITVTDSHALYPDAEGDGLPLIHINTALCQAVVAPQGAQLLSFTTAGGTPLIWLSPRCQFHPGKALRGGVPVCLPWFGPHPDGDKPQHGFARTSHWSLRQMAQAEDGRCELWFELRHPGDEWFPSPFRAGLRMTLGRHVEFELSLTNEGDGDTTFTWALHSYLPVDDLRRALVPVLSGRDYLDNLDQHARKPQRGPLQFDGEVDRVYPAIDQAVELDGQPRIRLEHDNCPSLVAWNPGPEKAADMADLGEGNEKGFVCLERGAVLDEGWTLAPGEKRTARMSIRAV